MMSDFGKVEAVLIVRTNDQNLLNTIKLIFPDEDDVSAAKRAVGGLEIKSWFFLGKEILGKILGFISSNRSKLSDAVIIIGNEEIRITGFDKNDAIDILESPGVQRAIAAYSQTDTESET